MDELASLQESARQIALERFRIIQPYLEQDKSLNVIAGKQESRIAQSSGFVGAPGPPRVSEADALQTAVPDWIYYSTRLRGASNTKAKRELRFAPRKLEWLAKRGAAA